MMARRSARLPDLLQRHGLAAAAMAGGVILSLYLLPLPQGAFAALLAALAIFIAVIDLEYRIIPDAANALMFASGLRSRRARSISRPVVVGPGRRLAA